MDKGEYIKNNFSEEDIRFYISKYYIDFELTSVTATNIVGTPDLVALTNGKNRLIELKRKLGDIAHQIRTNKLSLFNEVWYVYDDASDGIKNILLKNKISIFDISSYFDIEKLKIIKDINSLARKCYHLVRNKSFLIVNPHFVFDTMESIGLDKPNEILYEIDELFEFIFNTYKNDKSSFLSLSLALEKYEKLNETERISLAKRRKGESEKSLSGVHCKC